METERICGRIKRFASLSFVLSVVALLPAEGIAAPLIDFGATAGLNFIGLDDIDVLDASTTYDSRTGYHVGGFAEIGFGPLGIRAGLLYVNAGPLFEGLADIPGVPADFDDGFDVTFFAIPIDLQYRIPLPIARPYLLAGPELRFNTTSSDKFEDNFKDSILMGNIGAGVEFSLPIVGLSVAPELRYEFNLEGMTKDDLSIDSIDLLSGDEQDLKGWAVRVHLKM